MKRYACSDEAKVELKAYQKEVRETHTAVSVKKGLPWLADEVRELKEGIEKGDRENTKEELAQCLTWCFSIANTLNIDVSEIVEDSINLHLKKFPDHYTGEKL